MNVFVTGAAGFIGGSIATGLVKAGHHVTGLVRSAEQAAEMTALRITGANSCELSCRINASIYEADPDDVDTIKGNLPNAAAAIKKQLGGRVSVRVVLYDSKGRLITSATK